MIPATEVSADYGLLVGSRLGVVSAVRQATEETSWLPSLNAWVAGVSAISTRLPWLADRVATGAAFNDSRAARNAAIGEAVERYCGNFVPAGLRRSSYHELIEQGERAIDPLDLCLYADDQYDAPGFPFVRFTRDVEVLWTRGSDLLDGEATWVPGSLVWVNWHHGPRRGEPATNYPYLAGLAAGTSRADAEGRAIEELIERDAIEIWWRTRPPAARIDLGSDPGLLADLVVPSGRPVTFDLLSVPSPSGPPVIAAILQDAEHDIVTLGSASRLDPVGAARKAAAEAATLRAYSLGLLDPQGAVWQAAAAGVADGACLKPWRADRAYERSYRLDWTDVTDLGCQSQLYLDPGMRRWVEPVLDGPTVAFAGVRAFAGDRRQVGIAALAEQGLRPVSVDLTTADVALAGLSVVRVVAPGLYGNAPAAFPYLGGERQRKLPVRLGWLRRAPSHDSLVRAPLPHT